MLDKDEEMMAKNLGAGGVDVHKNVWAPVVSVATSVVPEVEVVQLRDNPKLLEEMRARFPHLNFDE